MRRLIVRRLTTNASPTPAFFEKFPQRELSAETAGKPLGKNHIAVSAARSPFGKTATGNPQRPFGPLYLLQRAGRGDHGLSGHTELLERKRSGSAQTKTIDAHDLAIEADVLAPERGHPGFHRHTRAAG